MAETFGAGVGQDTLFSLVFSIIRLRETEIFILFRYANASFVFRRRHREEDHVLHAGDSHKANNRAAAAEEKCPGHPTQQNPQGRGSGQWDEEADKGHEDRREFRDRAERGKSLRECRAEIDEEPGKNGEWRYTECPAIIYYVNA